MRPHDIARLIAVSGIVEERGEDSQCDELAYWLQRGHRGDSRCTSALIAWSDQEYPR
jgi:hypothetical protein